MKKLYREFSRFYNNIINGGKVLIILEKPYVSEFLIDSIVQNEWVVLENEVIKTADIEEGAIETISSEDAKNYYSQVEYPIIYSNSENAISWVLENLPDSHLTRYIKLFKDKVAFREMLKEIYPNFYYEEKKLEELKTIPLESLKFPFVLKPAVGFLSFGVHTVHNDEDWKRVLASIETEMTQNSLIYPQTVVDSSRFIIEELIQGEEFAIDAYYDKNGIPVILNIFQHPFLDSKDVKDRIYLMSVGLMVKYMSRFALLLKEIGDKNDIRNFPFHMEVRVTDNGDIIPIEVNPMRFAGWCTTDVAKYAWGINVYEYFMAQKKPDWNTVLAEKQKGVYYFSLAETPAGIDQKRIKDFDYKKYLKNFSNVLELRRINPSNNPLCAAIFGATKDKEEIKKILQLKTKDFTITS